MRSFYLLLLVLLTIPAFGQSAAAWIGPMPENDFQGILARVNMEDFDSKRTLVARQALAGRRLSADMLRRVLMVFDYDSNRLPFAKEAYPLIHDPYNYPVVCDAFEFTSSCDKLQAHILAQPAAAPVIYYHALPAADFSGLLARIREADFDRERKEIIQVALVGRQMPSSVLASLLREFDFESNRLAMAKAAYPLIADPHNYFHVIDAMEYSSSKRQLTEMIVPAR
jgi:Domain of unknown function (DUF4476)